MSHKKSVSTEFKIGGSTFFALVLLGLVVCFTDGGMAGNLQVIVMTVLTVAGLTLWLFMAHDPNKQKNTTKPKN